MSLRLQSEENFILRDICWWDNDSRTFYFVAQRGRNFMPCRLLQLAIMPYVVFAAIITQELELIL